MADREKRILDELEHCNENIRRTKELIAYHRDVLRKQERKADEIKDRLKKEKVRSLFDMIDKKGYDVDALKQALSSGKLTDTLSMSPIEVQTVGQTEDERDNENDEIYTDKRCNAGSNGAVLHGTGDSE